MISFYLSCPIWPHKNHIVTLKALKIIIDSGYSVSIVFSGADKGNLNYIKQQAMSLGIEKNVKFLGFVSAEELCQLYKKAFATVYASYLGPIIYLL